MKKNRNHGFAIAILSVLAFGFMACDGKEPKNNVPSTAQEARKTIYQCPMHHQIIRDHPGTCPICGMTLVAIALDSARAGEVRIDPTVIQNIGVRTEIVARRRMSAEIRLDGKVAADESRIRSVTARVNGYAEKLYASVSGQKVRQGETLLELYSPDLVSAQEELIQAIGAGVGSEALAESARRRLLNWGASEGFLANLEKTRRSTRRVPLASPIAGVVTRKNAIEGQSVMPGSELFQIADLSRVWVTARVYQADLAALRVGSPADIRFRNLPGRDFSAQVSFIAPEMDPATRTAEIRMELPNTPNLDLKPEMFAEVLLQGQKSDNVIAIPEQALIRAGGRDVAVTALGGGRFLPREVEVGRSSGGYVEILSGLSEGDSLVVSAQFLIDSESNLRAAVEQMRGPDAR